MKNNMKTPFTHDWLIERGFYVARYDRSGYLKTIKQDEYASRVVSLFVNVVEPFNSSLRVGLDFFDLKEIVIPINNITTLEDLDIFLSFIK